MTQHFPGNNLKSLCIISFLACLASLSPLHAQNANGSPNILFISVDDLNDWIGVLGGHPQAITPNIDRLANGGLLFENAYCAEPVCGASRAALLTGRRPSSTGIYQNPNSWKESPPLQGVTTLPQYFLANGYKTMGSGKIYHDGLLDPDGWDEYHPSKTQQRYYDPDPSNQPLNGIPNAGSFDWGPTDHTNEQMGDWRNTNYIIEQLGQTHDRPFFLACGLYRPHLPFYAPEEHFADFPLDQIQLPVHLENDLDDVPSRGIGMARTEDHEKVIQYDQWENAVRSYLACIKYADMIVGRVLDALENGPNANNTIVVLWSDHGWALGEKQDWRKFSLWEETNRVPLIFSGPGIPQGVRTQRLANLLDLYPTLIELAGLPEKSDLDGRSLVPVLENPGIEWPYPSLTTNLFGNHAIRDERWRYIRYNNGQEELYDHSNDPYEWTNLANDSQYDALKAHLRRYMPSYDYPSLSTNPNYVPPFTKFDVDNYTGAAPFTVNFDASVSFDLDGSVSTYEWDFGDGNNGTGVAPSHTYITTGTYVPILTVTDEQGHKSTYATTIIVEGENGNQIPVVDFDFAPSTGTAPIEISFTANASDPDGSIHSFSWSFGDGNSSSQQNPVHEFQNGGSFLVRLSVTDDQGAIATQTKSLTIMAPEGENAIPTAVISANPASGSVPLTVNFDGSASSDPDGGITSFDWRFGDGNSATGSQVSHTFVSPGTYTVELKVVDNDGAEGIATIQISVSEDNSGGASFILQAIEDSYVRLAKSGSNYGSGLTIQLKNNGSFSQEGYIKFSTSQNLTVNSAILRLFPVSGTNNIIIEIFGSSSNWNEGSLLPGNAPGTSTASLGTFSMQNSNSPIEINVSNYVASELQGGGSISFLVRSANSNKDIGTIYTKEGGFPAELVLNTGEEPGGGENQSPVAQISANPQSGAAPLTVVFSATGSSDPDGTITNYAWDFGDGNNDNGETVNHTYGSSGSFTAMLTVTDDDGSSDSKSIVITVSEPTGNMIPTASISANPTSGTAPLAVSFDGSASSDPDGSISSFQWSFGDGMNATGMQVSHTYSSVGTYLVELKVTDNESAEGITTTQISVSEENVGGGEILVLQAIEDSYVRLAKSGSNYGGSNSIQLKNNGSFSQEGYIKFTTSQGLAINSAFLRLFPTGGTSNIIVEVFGSATNWSEETLIPGNAPGASTGSLGTFSMQNASSPLEIDVSSYVASQLTGGGSISFLVRSANANKDIGTFFTKEGGFPAELVLNASEGPGGGENQSPTAQISANPQSGTAPLSVVFSAAGSSDPDGIITNYAWDFGDGNTENGETVNHIFSTNGNFTTTLTVTDDDGATDRETMLITVSEPLGNSPPTAVISTDPTSGTAPLAVSFDGSGSSDSDGSISSFNWTFGDGESATGESVVHGYDDPGIYLVGLTVIDNEGAEGSTTVQINVSDPNSVGEEVVLTVIEDSYVKLGRNTTNYGTQVKLQIKNNGNYSQDTYLKFFNDQAFSVNEAILRLFPVSGSSNMLVEVFGTSNAWTEETLLPTNAPSATTTSLGIFSMNNDSDPIEVDVSNYVASTLGGDGNISFLVKSANNNKDLGTFHSKEGDFPAELHIRINNSSALKEALVPNFEPAIPGVKIYPNPFSSELFLFLEEQTSTLARVSLYDLSGRIHGTWKLEDSHPLLYLNDLSELASGLYFLVIDFHGKTQGIKLIKN